MEPLNLKDDRIRILCEHNGDVYELYMGQGMKRRFTDETLPDEIKIAIGLINSFDWDELHRSNTLGYGQPRLRLLYICMTKKQTMRIFYGRTRTIAPRYCERSGGE